MAYDIYSQTPVYDGEGVRPQSDAEIEIELRNAARNGDLVVSKRNTLTGGNDFSGDVSTLKLPAGVTDLTGGVSGLAGTISVAGQSGAVATVPADTSEAVLATIVIPGGAMGANGRVEVLALWSYNNSAGTKTMRVKFGGSTVLTLPATTTQSSRTSTNIINRNSEASQMVGAVSGATGYQDFLGSASPNVAYTENTAADVTVQITGQKTSGADSLALEYYSVVVYPHG